MLLSLTVGLLTGISPPSQVSSGPPPVAVERAEPVGSFDIPDEIAPAVIPYMMCRQASRGIPMRSDGKEVAPIVPKGTDCTPFRAQAAENANAMLKRQGVPEKKRKAFVDATLTGIEDYDRRMDELMSGGDAQDR